MEEPWASQEDFWDESIFESSLVHRIPRPCIVAQDIFRAQSEFLEGVTGLCSFLPWIILLLQKA